MSQAAPHPTTSHPPKRTRRPGNGSRPCQSHLHSCPYLHRSRHYTQMTRALPRTFDRETSTHHRYRQHILPEISWFESGSTNPRGFEKLRTRKISGASPRKVTHEKKNTRSALITNYRKLSEIGNSGWYKRDPTRQHPYRCTGRPGHQSQTVEVAKPPPPRGKRAQDPEPEPITLEPGARPGPVNWNEAAEQPRWRCQVHRLELRFGASGVVQTRIRLAILHVWLSLSFFFQGYANLC